MPKKTNSKFFLGDIIKNGKQVSAFTIAPSIKRAAEIFDCKTSYIKTNFEIWDITDAQTDNRFSIAIDYPEQLFVSSNTTSDDYRLFLDNDRFTSSFKLFTDYKQKLLFIKNARKSKAKFVKVRLKDKLALDNKLLVDLYLDLTKIGEGEVKTLFFIPFNQKLIDERWQHRAIETNHKIETLINEIFDIYDEVVTPYSANEALEFIQLG